MPWRLAVKLLAIMTMMVSGCATLRQSPKLPVANSITLTQLVIYGDFDLPNDHRILTQLEQMRGQVSNQLDLPATEEPIHVYLFKTPERYRSFLQSHFPGFPERRAFFVQTDTRLSVYAHWGDRISEDLRHEVSHGYIHAAAPNIPLWIDEGLAEYFEVDTTFRGLNRVHLDHLITAVNENGWRPSLARLEQLSSIDDMRQIDYAEAWAWTHFLLETTSDRQELLRAYLKDLAEGRRTRDLASRIRNYEPAAEKLLWLHLERLAKAQASDGDQPSNGDQ